MESDILFYDQQIYRTLRDTGFTTLRFVNLFADLVLSAAPMWTSYFSTFTFTARFVYGFALRTFDIDMYL
jgi:hypothetical protein